MKPLTSAEQNDAYDATRDVDSVGLHAIGPTVKCAAKLLAQANKCQSDNDEEESTHHFDRHRVTKEIRHAIRVAEKNNFGRRTIDSVLHELAAGNFDDVRCRHTHDENERRPPEIVAAVASGQTTNRHSQEASQQHDVGEKRQVQRMSGKPTNRCQLEK